MNFTTTATKVSIIVESLPKIIDGLVARLGSGIKENTNLRLMIQSTHNLISGSSTCIKHLANGIKQPTVGIDLLLVLGFQDKNNLDRNEVVRAVLLRQYQLGSWINRKLSRVLLSVDQTGIGTSKQKNTSNMCATVSLPSTCFFIMPS